MRQFGPKRPQYPIRPWTELVRRGTPIPVVAKIETAKQALELAKSDIYSAGSVKQRRIDAIRLVISEGRVDVELAHKHISFRRAA